MNDRRVQHTFATFADDTWTPASAHTTTRRAHWMGSETTDYDEAWVYFDGSGRDLLSKAKAAPHPSTPSTPRFVGSGRVLLDAKGNPVKQYEPYFSATSDFEPDGGFDGVTPVLSYDPLGRLVRTDFPDGTHATVVRTPWSETHYDRADTLPDIDGYTPDPIVTPDEETLLQAILREFEAGVPGTLATGHPWLDARGNTSVAGVDDFLTIARGKALRRSAGQSWASRNTPTVVHVDPLGRPFLEQRAKTSTAGDTTDVHVTLDLQGRATAISARYVPEGETVRVTQLATTDVFDLLGRSLRHVRRDAQASGGTGGQTWVLPSVDGQPIRTWDSRDQAFRRTFDALRRPRATFVEEGSSGEVCRLFTRYGEWATTPKAARLLGRPWRVYDTAGLVTTLAVDVDNRVTSTSRRFLEAFRGLPDWTSHEDDPDSASEPTWLQDAAGTDPEVYTQTATLDIAGRPLHDAVYRDVAAQHERRYGYDAGGLLVSVEVQSPGTSGWRPVVHDVTYNARGQRLSVLAGDDTGDASLETTYSYDADTFRLVRLAVTRLTDDEVLQDIRWVHDAVGNVTFQEDLGTDAVWFDNTTVQPHRKYAYDALDRLIEATGREHQSTFSATGGDTRQTHRPYGLGPKAHAADGNALRSYTQRYTYDDVGNLRQLSHVVGTETTNRTYAYAQEVDGSLFNNRLLSTTVGSTTYPLTYDAHGNVTSMSHLPEMAWDAFDRLASVQTTARYPDVGADDEDEDELETPVDHDWFYIYDGAGQRVRKVRASGSSGEGRWEERLYVGPFEVWRKYDGSGDTSVERETLHVQDGDRRVAMVETLTWDGGAEETSPVARWRYQLDDHLGTACGEVTETGLVIGWEEYHPYGTTAVWSFDSTREVSGKRYRYTGMERDDETGLGYHSARYYAGWLGRWVSPDPIGIHGGLNLYEYVASMPSAKTDQTGRAPKGPNVAVGFEDEKRNQISEPVEITYDLSGLTPEEQRSRHPGAAQAQEMGLEAFTARPDVSVIIVHNPVEVSDLPKRLRAQVPEGAEVYQLSYDISLKLEGGKIESVFLVDPKTLSGGAPVALGEADKMTISDDEATHRQAIKDMPDLIKQALGRGLTMMAPGIPATAAGPTFTTIRGTPPRYAIVEPGGDLGEAVRRLDDDVSVFSNEVEAAASSLRAHGPTYGSPDGLKMEDISFSEWQRSQNPYSIRNGVASVRKTPIFVAPSLPNVRWLQ